VGGGGAGGARARAEASDWRRVFPALVAHYQRLLGARGVLAANDAAGRTTNATTALER